MIKKKPKGAPTTSGTPLQNHHTQSHKKKLRPSKDAAHPKASKPPLSTHDAVREYLPRGLAPVPIPKGKKGPVGSGWPGLVVTDDTVSHLFEVDGNVGIRTGPKSGDHVDVDVDDKEALELAELLLPTTAMTSGREGQGPSHYGYIAPGAKTTAWKDELGMIVELRADGVQQARVPVRPRERRSCRVVRAGTCGDGRGGGAEAPLRAVRVRDDARPTLAFGGQPA